MPEGVATADLPWDGLFTAVPGINSMRATYRWYGVTRFAVVVLAGLAVTQLLPLGGRWRWIASCWQHCAVIELAPNLPLYRQLHDARHEDSVAFSNEVEPGPTRDDAEWRARVLPEL